MNQTRNQLRAALKNRTLDEFYQAKDLPRRLIKSYAPGELKNITQELDKSIKEKEIKGMEEVRDPNVQLSRKEEQEESRKAIKKIKGLDEFFKALRKIVIALTALLLLVGPWSAFASQSEPVQEEQQIVQLLAIEAYISPEDFAPFDRSGEDCPNVAVIIYLNKQFLFEVTASPDTSPKAVWDCQDSPHEIYISYFPSDVFTVYLVHVPDPGEEQRDTIELWEVSGQTLAEFPTFCRHLLTDNGSYIVFIFNEVDTGKPKPEEPEEEGEGYFEATEAGIIIKGGPYEVESE